MDKAISVMVLCSSHEIVSLKLKKKYLSGLLFIYRSNEPSHAPKFEWPGNTSKIFKWSRVFYNFVLPGKNIFFRENKKKLERIGKKDIDDICS